MSDFIIKLIPKVVGFQSSADQNEKVLNYLRANIKADSIMLEAYDTPAFVDCGENLDRISCPFCGERITFDWWKEAMDVAYINEFQNLNTLMPCCGKESSLNDLQYDFPCGFSCVEFDILNPISVLQEEQLDSVAKILGIPIRIIMVRY